MPEELLKDNVEDLLSGLENKKSQETTLQKYTEKKMDVIKDMHKSGLDKHVVGEMGKFDIEEIIAMAIKESAGANKTVSPFKQKVEENKDKDEDLMSENVEIAMEKLKDRVFDSLTSNPMRLLSVVDETHPMSAKVQIEGFLWNSSAKMQDEAKQE